jgi:inner membrane protein
VVTPVFGEALMRLLKVLRDHRALTYLAVYLAFATHALLDAMTIYGTRLFWPLMPDPVGIGSIFIIDPLYTLPLLVAMIWALCLRSWSRKFGVVAVSCLVLSTAYLGWGLVAQRIVDSRARALLAHTGLMPAPFLTLPTHFNSLFWRVILVAEDRYLNLYVPVFGAVDGASAYQHPRGSDISACLDGNGALATLAWFSRGFFRLDQRGKEIVFSDLRMGLTPSYAFQFVIAERGGDGIRPIPPRYRGDGGGTRSDVDWLLANLWNPPAVRPAEAKSWVDLSRSLPALKARPMPVSC